MRGRNFALVLISFLALSNLGLAAPTINLSKRIGPPTTQIFVSGSGFEANVGVNIYFDTTDQALVVTNGQGQFHNAVIHAPRSAHPGEHWVTALERNNDEGDQEPFVVNTNWPAFNFQSDHAGWNPYENVLDQNNVSGLQLKWSNLQFANIGGGPVVVDGVVYTGQYALDAATGTILWQQNVGPLVSVPTVANSIVYVGSYDGLYALASKNGAILWKYTTGSEAGSPTFSSGVVYFGCHDGNVYALNAASGKLLWSYATGSPADGPPAVANASVYISAGFSLYAIDAKTGNFLWSYNGGNTAGEPSVANGVVYFGVSGGSLYALDASSGDRLWDYPTGSFVYSCPAIALGVVYVDAWDGFLYALDAATGNFLWDYPTGPGVSVVVANGVVYAGNASIFGTIFAIGATTGNLLWSYVLNYPAFYSEPVVANGVLYASGEVVDAFSLDLGTLQNEPSSGNRPKLMTLHPTLEALNPTIVNSR